MSIDTFVNLRTEIAEYLHRTNIDDSQLDNFIDAASRRIGTGLRHNANLGATEVTAFIHLTGLEIYFLPADFVEMRYVHAAKDDFSGDFRILQSISQTEANRVELTGSQSEFWYIESFMQAADPQAAQLALVLLPQAQSLGEQIWPHYWQVPSTLDISNPVLIAFPYLYLYACLIEAHTFVQDFDMRDKMLLMYVEELKQANDTGMQARLSPGSRIAPVRQRVASRRPVSTM